MAQVINVAPHAVDLPGGTFLAPGAVAEVPDQDEHVLALLDAGLVDRVGEATPAKTRGKTKGGE